MIAEAPEKKFHRGLQPTPTDEITGLPYVILPHKGEPIHPLTGANVGTSPHHAAHPHSRKELLLTEFGVVTRTARMQDVAGPGGSLVIGGTLTEWHMPHQRYHYFCSGPQKLPVTEDEQFEYAVWAGSLYVPPYGLNVNGNKLKIQKLNDKQIELLHSGQIRVGCDSLLRGFLRGYVVRRGLPYLGNNLIDEFMNTIDISRKQRLGRKILALGSEVAVEPLEADYEIARKTGRVHPYLNSPAPTAVRLQVSWGKPETVVNSVKRELLAA